MKRVRAKLVRLAVAVAMAAAVVAMAAVVEAAAAVEAVMAAAIVVRAKRELELPRLCLSAFVSNEIAQNEAATAQRSSDVLLNTQTEEPLCQTNPPKNLSRSRSKEAKTLPFRQFPNPQLALPQAR